MTLIARISFNGIPIYIGDLLLSSKLKPNHSVDIPAARDVNARLPQGSERAVHELRQKVNLIGDRLIMSWAGSYLQARSLLGEIRDASENGVLSLEDIRRIIESRDLSDRNELQLVGTLSTPDSAGGVHLQHFEYCVAPISMGGIDIYAGGTGADDLLEIIPQVVAANPMPDCTPGSPDHFDWAVSQALGLLGSFVGHEAMTGQNILDWWGGGIEIASLVEGRFQKLGNVLHTTWRAIRVDSSHYEIRFVPRLMKYDYFEDAFVVQTFNLTINGASKKAAIEEHAYRIYTPILKSRRDYDLSRFQPSGLTNKILCCYVLLEPQVSSLGNLTRVYYDASGETPFRIVRLTDGLMLSFRDDLLRGLEADVSNATGLPASVCQIRS